jgi:hypothetical protein
MDWSNERWVRVYVRDTTDWVALSWQARALFVLLLRKVDRSGVLDMGKQGPRGVAGLLGVPLDVVASALAELVGDGCVEQHGTSLVVPNFLEAQEAPASDRQRARESRARRRERVRAQVDVTIRDADVTNRDSVDNSVGPVDNSAAAVTNRDSGSRDVTNRDADVTNRIGSVTRGHAASRGVTRCHSDPSDLTLTREEGDPEPTRAIPAVRTPVHGVRSAEWGQPAEPVERLARRACGETLWNAHQTARREVAAVLGQECRDLPATDQGRRLLQDRIAELAETLPLADAERVCREVLGRVVEESKRDNTLRYLTGSLWEKKRFDTTYGLVGQSLERPTKPINGSHPRGSGIGAMFADIAEREAKGER